MGRNCFPKENHDAVTNCGGMVAMQLEMSDAHCTTEGGTSKSNFLEGYKMEGAGRQIRKVIWKNLYRVGVSGEKRIN